MSRPHPHLPLLAVLLFALPGLAGAEDLCEPRESIQKRVTYCYQNWDYLQPGQACIADFKKLVADQQKRSQAILAGLVAVNAMESAQKKELQTNAESLRSTISDFDYLIDYGKQVHSELEDYGYDLVVPVYDDEDAKPDLSDPDTRAKLAERECYSDPAEQLSDLEKSIRPMIADLEKTKKELEAQLATTTASETGLAASGNRGVTSKAKGDSSAKGNGPPQTNGASTITGHVDADDK